MWWRWVLHWQGWLWACGSAQVSSTPCSFYTADRPWSWHPSYRSNYHCLTCCQYYIQYKVIGRLTSWVGLAVFNRSPFSPSECFVCIVLSMVWLCWLLKLWCCHFGQSILSICWGYDADWQMSDIVLMILVLVVPLRAICVVQCWSTWIYLFGWREIAKWA